MQLFVNFLLVGVVFNKGFPSSPTLEVAYQCNGLVGLWRDTVNQYLTSRNDWPIGIYIARSKRGVTAYQNKMAVLKYNKSIQESFFFGKYGGKSSIVSGSLKKAARCYNNENRRCRKYRFSKSFIVEERYVNGEGNWCMVWNVGDGGYIFESEYPDDDPVGLIFKISDEERNKLFASSEESQLKAWSIKFNQYMLNYEEMSVGIGKRSKGCYFFVTVNNNMYLASVDAYNFLVNSTWGINDLDRQFNIATFNLEQSSFSKLFWDHHLQQFLLSHENFYMRSPNGVKHVMGGPSINPGVSLYININPCDPNFNATVDIFYEKFVMLNRRLYNVGKATPLTDLEARSG